jgi:hypothetical protein
MAFSESIVDLEELFPGSPEHKYAYLLKVDKHFIQSNTLCQETDTSPRKRNKRSLALNDKTHVQLRYASKQSQARFRHFVNTSVQKYTYPTGQRLLPLDAGLESAQQTEPELCGANETSISKAELAENDVDGTAR